MALLPHGALGVRSGLPALAGALFLLLLLGFPALFVFGDYGVRDNADTRRQSLLLALFLAVFDVEIHVVGSRHFFS